MNKNLKGWLLNQWIEILALNRKIQERSERWRALYNKGGGMTSEFIFADFNTDCPNGLDVEPRKQEYIKFQSIIEAEWFQKLEPKEQIAKLTRLSPRHKY